MAKITRQEWNKLATEKTSGIVGGEVEVIMMNDTINILSESKEIAYKAVELYQNAGSSIVKEIYYEADEEMPEAWSIEMTI